MPVSLKITLKKKPTTDLSHVRCTIEKRGGDCKKLSVEEFPSPVKDYVVSGKAGYNNKDQTHVSRKRKFLEATHLKKGTGNISYNEENKSGATDAFKHDNTGRLDGQNGGGWKMDISKIMQCTNVLKTLMNHPSGWVFNQPVDPVALNIPDYFSIISKPMDLGTIKHKLGRKLYPSTNQFAADVRLTFSNAMRYNPPHNYVHMMAKDLNGIFNARWKSVEFRWRKECPNSSQLSARKTAKKQSVTSEQVLQRTSSCNSSSLYSKFLTAADKLKLQNSLAKFLGRCIPPQLLNYLRKRCLLDPSERRTSVDIDALDDETLWELHEIVRSCGDAESTKPPGLKRKSQVLVKDADKGTGGTLVTSGSVNSGSCTTTTLAYKDTSHPCVDTDHPDICHRDFSKASFSDVSERSSYHQNVADHSIASKLDGENISVVLVDDNGCHTFSETGTAIVDVDNRQHTSDSSSPAVAIPLTEAELPCEEQLSPTRAFRAAMLKSRFADTILKAQHRTLLNHGEKCDPTRMQREKEKLEKMQQEEKTRIEAQVRAAEAAARLKAEVDLKMQREREREAARLALQKMEKTVDIDEDSQFFKELENLGYSQPVHLDLPDTLANFMNAIEQQSALLNPLAQLGLFIKEDDLEEDIDNGYVEEGEIGSF